MQNEFDALTSLHTALIDCRNGYDGALKDTEGKGLVPLFRKMSALHSKHAADLTAILLAGGHTADDDGSFMTTVHRTIISVRSLFGDLDERILPGLIDGEKRVISYSDEALAATGHRSERDVLLTQRKALEKKISEMELRKNLAA